MPRTRRLRGVAALSAATLATAGLVTPASAVDECAEQECIQDQLSLSDLVTAFGGEEMPEEALAKVEFIYEQLGLDNPAEAFLKLGDVGGGDPEGALAKLTDIYEQLGVGDVDDAFLKLGDIGELFWKVEEGEAAPDEAFLKLGALDELFAKLEAAEMDGDEALIKIGDAMPAIEEALIKLGLSEDIDPAMLELMLQMLPEDE